VTLIEHRVSPINGLSYAPEWAGTNIFLSCRAVADETDQLMQEELVCIADAAERRRNTFSSGRAAARAALSQAGLPPGALPGNNDGSVQWPEGVIGSLTHTNDWAIAAVAMPAMSEADCLGVDLEQIQPLQAGVLKLIATDVERAEIDEVPNKHWLAVALFSMKESVYKCLRPSFGQFFGFQDVEIRNLASGRPSIRFLSDALQAHCNAEHTELRMAVTPEHVFTLAWLRQS
jgi:4'-phosphopantetheinyl transferase EntD